MVLKMFTFGKFALNQTCVDPGIDSSNLPPPQVRVPQHMGKYVHDKLKQHEIFRRMYICITITCTDKKQELKALLV